MTRLIQSNTEMRPEISISVELSKQNKITETLKTQYHESQTNYYSKPDRFCGIFKQYNVWPGDK